MNRPYLAGLMKEINDKRLTLMLGKGHDYADEDALSNFKRMTSICWLLGIRPEKSAADCAKFLMMLKIDRWCNLARQGKDPANEGIRDTIEDLHNYIDLAYACEMDSRNEL